MENRWVHLAAAAFAAAAIAGHPTAIAGQQGSTTGTGEPPAITGSGQTNWASHNLDLYNQRFSELDQTDTATGGRLQRRWSYDVAPGLNVGQSTYPPGFDASSLNYSINSSPAYRDNTLYVASAISEGNIPGGLVLAADTTTGRIQWVFNTIPQRPQDEGWETGESTCGDGKRVGAGVWTQPPIDVELGLVLRPHDLRGERHAVRHGDRIEHRAGVRAAVGT